MRSYIAKKLHYFCNELYSSDATFHHNIHHNVDTERSNSSSSVLHVRVLLAAVSPYFRAMFTSPLVESRLTEIRLEEVTPSVMETVIQFVYTGEAGLSLDTAEDLFVAANRLQVMPLQDLCSR